MTSKRLVCLLMCFSAAVALCTPAVSQVAKVRVGSCARTISSGAAPFAVATRMGWFKEDGIEVSLVPLAGSSDCVKAVTTREIPFALAALEPHAAAVQQGVRLKTFYTGYQGNIYTLAVPADSSIYKVGGLKGKTIGVISMGGGVLFAKALVASAGLNPEGDVTFVVAGNWDLFVTMCPTRFGRTMPVTPLKLLLLEMMLTGLPVWYWMIPES